MAKEIKQTPLQQFVRLLLLAHEASEAVDYFDLASQKKESREQFKKLCKKQKKAFKALHELCNSVKFKDIKSDLHKF